MRWLFLIPVFLMMACEEPLVEIATQKFTFHKEGATVPLGSDPDSPQHYFQRLDSTAVYGITFRYKLKPEDDKKRMALILKAKARTNYIYSNATIVVVTHRGTDQVHWQPYHIRGHFVDLNVWNNIYDSILLPMNDDFYHYDNITAFASLEFPKAEKFDMDSVTFILKRVK